MPNKNLLNKKQADCIAKNINPLLFNTDSHVHDIVSFCLKDQKKPLTKNQKMISKAILGSKSEMELKKKVKKTISSEKYLFGMYGEL